MYKLLSCIILICIFSFSNAVLAQVSVLEGKSGETSYIINGKGIYINTSNTEISGAYTFGKGQNAKITNYGISGKVKSTEGVSSILEGRKFKAEFTGNVYVMFNIPSGIEKKDESTYIYILGGIKRGAYNILTHNDSTSFNQKVFVGMWLTGGVNVINSLELFGNKHSYIIGGSLSYGSYNNIDQLKDVQRFTSVSSTFNNQVTTILKDKKNGYTSDYKTTEGLRINLDGYIYPYIFQQSNIGVGGFFRMMRGEKFSTSNVGLGLLFGDVVASEKIILGVFYRFENVLGEVNEGVKKSFSLNAGYNF